MAELKLVDAEKLDSDLGKVASQIKTVTGVNDSISFPDGFVSSLKNVDMKAISKFVDYSTEWGTIYIDSIHIGSQLFHHVNAQALQFTNCKQMPASLLFENNYVKTVRLCNATLIRDSSFQCAYALERLIIETESDSDDIPPCVLQDAGGLSSTQIEYWSTEDAGVYVPAHLVEAYKADSNWLLFDIRPIPDKDKDPEGYSHLYGDFEEGSV